ncbi:hypothetical protein [Streptacidiphilus carbonis]|uniref:hypothetical protein n=1 Tax=Streptacidiphilus carbonis TaxID=105422 RepID=UPI0006932870|nr:hypothetical protein [Streptacidiphilus carbonis]
MSFNRSRRIDRATAERLLSGGAGGVPAGQDPLADLLNAAAAPAADAEPAGEQAALAAFRAGPLTDVPPVRRGSMFRPTLAKLLSAKVAAAFAATALSGVAVAAGTGHLPSVLPGGPTTTATTTATPRAVPSGSASSSPSAVLQQNGGGSPIASTSPSPAAGAAHGASARRTSGASSTTGRSHASSRPTPTPAHSTGRPSSAPSRHGKADPTPHATG